MEIAFLLIAFGFGFRIYSDVHQSNKKQVRKLGKLVGIIIMIVAFAGTACKTYHQIKDSAAGCSGGYFCPMHGSMMSKKKLPYYDGYKKRGLPPGHPPVGDMSEK